IGVDAAILFCDILIPLEPMGLTLTISEGEGPRIHNPVRSAADVERLAVPDPMQGTRFVMDAIRQIRASLAGKVPLIGFAGAPFTLAAYAVEGAGSRNYIHIKRLMYEQPKAAHALFDKLTETVIAYLRAQIEAGVQVVQVFDSWAGHLSRADYREFALPHTTRIFEALAGTVPLIHFGVGTTAILGDLAQAGGDVIGVDWRLPLDEAWTIVGTDRAIQGNLDPAVLLGPADRLFAATEDVLRRANGRPGHIFNLGHGVLPSTPLEHVQALARFVHQWKA
ncbi:MAG TPA: uroporphyrinogen decarboxylase, partial [Vicinamibacterales bacterium]|nr:uroporphyrinogen decarboxylase [Vicinamibacterales bacterium]